MLCCVVADNVDVAAVAFVVAANVAVFCYCCCCLFDLVAAVIVDVLTY